MSQRDIAIQKIFDYAESKKYFKNKLYKENKNEKISEENIKKIKEYIEDYTTEKNGIKKPKKSSPDYERRIIANYFVKINILIDKGLISRKLVRRFWSPEALFFVGAYIMPIQYIALKNINDEEIENYRKELRQLYDNLNFCLSKRNEPYKINEVFYDRNKLYSQN